MAQLLKPSPQLLILLALVWVATVGCIQETPNQGEPVEISDAMLTDPAQLLTPSPTVPVDQVVGESRTETAPLPSMSPTETATFTATASPQPEMSLVPANSPTTTPFVPQAQSANTATPTPPATATEAPAIAQQADPFALSATAIVREITITVEIQQTMTAMAQGIGITPTPQPTFTLTPAPFVQPTQAQQPVPTGANCIHEVRAGETLWSISQYYGALVRDIAAASGITNIQLISIGQRLTIPGCGTRGAIPPPTSTPSPTPGLGSAPVTTGGNVGSAPIASGQIHVVEQGETLFSIAAQYGVSVQAIARLNGILNTNMIMMSTELQIPASSP